MTTARSVAQVHVVRWLALHTLTDDELRMIGHYGEPSPEEQKAGVDAIASAINGLIGIAPSKVV